MTDFTTAILTTLSHKHYTPLKSKALARKLHVSDDDYPTFRKALKSLISEGRIEIGKNNVIRPADAAGTVVGTFRRIKSGAGYVRPHAVDGVVGTDVFVRDDRTSDASTGDEVVVKLLRKAGRVTEPTGEVVRIQERATRTFVGTYFERDGEAHVRVDGTLFAHSVLVGDSGAKGAKQGDKVVLDMIRFPTPDDRGEGVITEVLGPLSKPGVDTISIIKSFGLPEAFPPAALDEARSAAAAFREDDLHGRTDFTDQLVIAVDPVDARDFDDAVSVEVDPATKHWVLTVHIADVAHFAPVGGPLDAEARNRATSVYLPQKVIPMFPEVISNGVASLQEGKVRYVKTVQIEYTPGLQIADVRFYNGAIRNRKRFTYEEVQKVFDSWRAGSVSDRRKRGTHDREAIASGSPPVADAPGSPRNLVSLLRRMKDLAAMLRKKRVKRGMLELAMPETVLEYDAEGKVSGAHFAQSDDSHRVIEEFMLAANEAVAGHFAKLGMPILRRVHPAPNPEKLGVFGQFAKLLGYPMTNAKDRFELQRVLRETADKPERSAVHYSLLRSLKQATYSPVPDEHFALASPDYCHFTSPIRRYPDLTVHRLLDRWVRTGKASADKAELHVLGDHCSKRERRAETAERELVKLKVLRYMSTRIGEKLDAVITGVADYGFFAQAETIPAEGLVHISSLTDDYYRFDEDHHALFGGRTKTRFRLGDRVRVEITRVDLQRRMLDLRIASQMKSSKRRR
jgi:ribonuclease R